jgi:hypothetical protein
MPRSRRWYVAAAALVAALATSRATFAAHTLVVSWRDGLEFTSRTWRESPTVMAARTLPRSTTVFSNVPGLILLRTELEACQLPAWDRTPAGAVASAETLRRRLVQAGQVVFFDNLERDFLLSEADMLRYLLVEATHHTSDGAIYRLRNPD